MLAWTTRKPSVKRWWEAKAARMLLSSKAAKMSRKRTCLSGRGPNRGSVLELVEIDCNNHVHLNLQNLVARRELERMGLSNSTMTHIIVKSSRLRSSKTFLARNLQAPLILAQIWNLERSSTTLSSTGKSRRPANEWAAPTRGATAIQNLRPRRRTDQTFRTIPNTPETPPWTAFLRMILDLKNKEPKHAN